MRGAGRLAGRAGYWLASLSRMARIVPGAKMYRQQSMQYQLPFQESLPGFEPGVEGRDAAGRFLSLKGNLL